MNAGQKSLFVGRSRKSRRRKQQDRCCNNPNRVTKAHALLHPCQNMMFVRMPKIASLLIRLSGCDGFWMPPDGIQKYWKSGCTTIHGKICARYVRAPEGNGCAERFI